MAADWDRNQQKIPSSPRSAAETRQGSLLHFCGTGTSGQPGQMHTNAGSMENVWFSFIDLTVLYRFLTKKSTQHTKKTCDTCLACHILSKQARSTGLWLTSFSSFNFTLVLSFPKTLDLVNPRAARKATGLLVKRVTSLKNNKNADMFRKLDFHHLKLATVKAPWHWLYRPTRPQQLSDARGRQPAQRCQSRR